jgi:hypothetical protein
MRPSQREIDNDESSIISTYTTITTSCCCPGYDENGNGGNTTSPRYCVGHQKAKKYRLGEVERERSCSSFEGAT